MKYLYIISLCLICLIFIMPNGANAGPTEDACRNKKNGEACEYKENDSDSTTIKGYCDSTGSNLESIFGRLYCNKDVQGWEDCFFLDDACASNCKVGVCASRENYSRGLCDTDKYPDGFNPGGATPPKCGDNPCSNGKVCIFIDNKPTCTTDAKDTGNFNCGDNLCPSGKVCANDIDGKPTCYTDAVTPGTEPASCLATPTPTPTPTPQTVGFNNPIKFTTIIELIAGIINALLGILGAITVAVLVMSGFKYMTSSNPGEVGQALDGIKNAVIGLIIIMGAFLITQYVITALAV